jgi:hypothetical protein
MSEVLVRVFSGFRGSTPSLSSFSSVKLFCLCASPRSPLKVHPWSKLASLEQVLLSIRQMKRLSLTIAVAACCFSGFGAQLPEPEYGGRTISQWLATEGQDAKSTDARKTAILQIGTNALPFLIEALQGEVLDLDDPNWEQKVPAWRDGLIRKINALEGFALLGARAALAIPELMRLSKPAPITHNRQAAIDALGCLHETGLPAQLTIVADQAHPERANAIVTIGMAHRELGTNGRPAVPFLLSCLRDKNSSIVSVAAEALCKLQLDAETVVPAVTTLMQIEDGSVRAEVLSYLKHWPGAGALYASTVVAALEDRELEVRQFATNLLAWTPDAIRAAGKMGEQARRAVPVIVEALAYSGSGDAAAEALGNLCFDPPLVIPALRHRVRDFQTPVAVASANALGKFGPKASWAAPDLMAALADSRLEVRVAATNALLNIMPAALQASSATNNPVKNTNPGIFRL